MRSITNIFSNLQDRVTNADWSLQGPNVAKLALGTGVATAAYGTVAIFSAKAAMAAGMAFALPGAAVAAGLALAIFGAHSLYTGEPKALTEKVIEQLVDVPVNPDVVNQAVVNQIVADLEPAVIEELASEEAAPVAAANATVLVAAALIVAADVAVEDSDVDVAADVEIEDQGVDAVAGDVELEDQGVVEAEDDGEIEDVLPFGTVEPKKYSWKVAAYGVASSVVAALVVAGGYFAFANGPVGENNAPSAG